MPLESVGLAISHWIAKVTDDYYRKSTTRGAGHYSHAYLFNSFGVGECIFVMPQAMPAVIHIEARRASMIHVHG